MNPNKRYPIKFQAYEEQADPRFTRGRSRVMHLGENYNGSIFTEEATLKTIPKLANIPVTGYVAVKQDGSADFAGHEEIYRNDEWLYLCAAYGIVPEDNKAQLEDHITPSGRRLRYLTTDVLLWNKYKSYWGIMLDTNERAVSMELNENYTGNFNEDGYFVFEDYLIEAICMLGKDVLPAMDNANIQLQKNFSKTINNQVAEMLKEYKSQEENQVLTNKLNYELNKTLSLLTNNVGDGNDIYNKLKQEFSKLNNLLK